MSELKFVIRRPRFPIICQIGAELVAGNTLQQFERRLKKVNITAAKSFKIVDGTGEGWVLHPDLSAISPFTFDRIWTKARVIESFNRSANAQRAGLQYPQRSLANRRLDAVIRDVAELLEQAERTASHHVCKETGA